jgi:hypothetical protein
MLSKAHGSKLAHTVHTSPHLLIELGRLIPQYKQSHDSEQEEENNQNNPIPPNVVFRDAKTFQEILTARAILIVAPFIPEAKIDTIFQCT